MAGLDYSYIREPDYNLEKLRQPQSISDYIKELCENIYTRWKQRDTISQELLKGKDYITRQRHVYYDTDSIMENQTQRFKVCSKCSGVNTIESSSDRGIPIFAVTIPRDACSSCVDNGYKIYKDADIQKYYRVYLQDRTNDTYLTKGVRRLTY